MNSHELTDKLAGMIDEPILQYGVTNLQTFLLE